MRFVPSSGTVISLALLVSVMTERTGSPILDLLAVFLVVYALQTLSGLVDAMPGLFVLAPPIQNDPWTVVTSVYAHANPGHLLSNAVALLLFGYAVAAATTRTRFHLFFLVTGALAGISQILFSDLLAETPVVNDLVGAAPLIDATATGGVLGASGAVFALLGYLLASNRLVAGLGAVADVPSWVTYFVFVVLAIAVTAATASQGVALIAHFTGLLLGLLAGWVNLLRPPTAGTDTTTRTVQ
jgi:membrane associated rhomboid family serine protease